MCAEIDLLYQAALVWKELTEYEYIFTYGYKKHLYSVKLTFSADEFAHLAGFQYLTDLGLPRYNSKKILDKILENKIKFEDIIKGAQYISSVEPRLKALINLKEIIDNEFKLFSYMPQFYPFTTTIKANYLISSHLNSVSFVFIIQDSTDGKASCNYLCCSAFIKDTRDYEANQQSRTILKKERIHKPTETSEILLDKLTTNK